MDGSHWQSPRALSLRRAHRFRRNNPPPPIFDNAH
ncbi:hypothetical protein D039_2051A, partial [Vibrio parahaemolyticus EKP-028]